MTTPYIHASGALYKFLRDSGGNNSMNVNGSITPVEYSYKCPENCQAVLTRLNISIIQDDLTSIVDMGMQLQGYFLDANGNQLGAVR